MERFKVDEYIVIEKGREYSVLVFPFVEHMWAYDCSPEEYRYMLDGTAIVFKYLEYAMAILVEASDKIIYFPCRQSGIGRYYGENYDLVICTPKVQLRRSSWVNIRRKLNNSTKRGRYVLQYDRKKLDDFCEKKVLDMQNCDLRRRVVVKIKPEHVKKIRAEHIEKVEGATMFWVLGKTECYCAHYYTARDVGEMEADGIYRIWSWFGWYLSPKVIQEMYEEAEEESKV